MVVSKVRANSHPNFQSETQFTSNVANKISKQGGGAAQLLQQRRHGGSRVRGGQRRDLGGRKRAGSKAEEQRSCCSSDVTEGAGCTADINETWEEEGFSFLDFCS
ncbi:hypothetical protein SESBI_10575 [Sesbania bispinosa]|nr:hypothetical protein SESBI_10575 [Sesbania bispinosa]